MKKIFTPVRDRSLICLRIIHSLSRSSKLSLHHKYYEEILKSDIKKQLSSFSSFIKRGRHCEKTITFENNYLQKDGFEFIVNDSKVSVF